jgi:glycosyltransferase involved in cell wall biosynthesis
VLELGLALGRRPDLEAWFVLNRDLPAPAATVEKLRPYGRLAYSDDSDLPRDAIYHVPSPFEPSPLDRIWPPELRSQRFAVTLHDLIPAVFPDEVMPDSDVRRAYWARAELIRQADRIMSVSEATASDAVRLLGVRHELISVTGGGVSSEFRLPASRSDARAELQALRPEIDGEFVLYTGGMDYRKNIGVLLSAYAGLPGDLRARYKLVLVGRLGRDDPSGPFLAQAESLGIADRVVFTGFVSDEELVLLYQGTSLFVFPSLYEGFGLPVVEALACGAPAIAGRNSSLVELIVNEEALFDPADRSSIEAALAGALADEQLLERLRHPELRERFSWTRIAELTAAAYEETALRPRPPDRVRKRILCVAPLPAEGADGETTRRVLEALADRCEVDLLVGELPGMEHPAGIGVFTVDALDRIDHLRGYDERIYWLGNAPEYTFALEVLRARPGIVIAYNVCLKSLYDDEPWRANGQVNPRGEYHAREAITFSSKFLVHVPAAVSLARVEAASGDESKVGLLPLPLPRVATEAPQGIAVLTGGPEREAERLLARLRTLAPELVINARSDEHEPGFVTALAQSRAAGLPTLLLGLTLGDLPADNEISLGAEATDVELRAALESLKRGARPISPAEADASVDAVADRLCVAIRELSVAEPSAALPQRARAATPIENRRE